MLIIKIRKGAFYNSVAGGGYGKCENVLFSFVVILVLETDELFVQVTCPCEKFFTLMGEGDTGFRTMKQGDADFIFELM